MKWEFAKKKLCAQKENLLFLPSMKRSLAIFFLIIVLFNIAGYYLVIEGWKWHNSVTWSFEESMLGSPELIIEIPLVNVQYPSQEKDWERADAPFEYSGEVYRIINKRLTQDALFIDCVKDIENNRINEQLKDFANTFSDRPVDGKENVKHFPGFTKEYLLHSITIKSTTGWSQVVKYILPPQSLVPSFFSSIVHPPERIS